MEECMIMTQNKSLRDKQIEDEIILQAQIAMERENQGRDELTRRYLVE